MLIVAAIASIWQSMTHETNSRAATLRGTKAYAAQKYDPSAKAFRDAATLMPSPRHSFNLGTAQVAAGRQAEGSATLSEAMREPSLRADALYNRGNSALAAKAYEHAIRDYSDALRLRPTDAQTKRNLEIALAQLQSMRQQQSAGNQQQPKLGSPPPQQSPQQQSPSTDPQRQEGDAEALLRSVQQQEQEEMARMKRARASRARVGW